MTSLFMEPQDHNSQRFFLGFIKAALGKLEESYFSGEMLFSVFFSFVYSFSP